MMSSVIFWTSDCEFSDTVFITHNNLTVEDIKDRNRGATVQNLNCSL